LFAWTRQKNIQKIGRAVVEVWCIVPGGSGLSIGTNSGTRSLFICRRTTSIGYKLCFGCFKLAVNGFFAAENSLLEAYFNSLCINQLPMQMFASVT
jgi:hypothetical protein